MAAQAPLIFEVLVVILSTAIPHLINKKKYLLLFLVAILVIEFIWVWAFANTNIAGTPLALLVTLACSWSGFQGAAIGAIELGIGKNKLGEIVNQKWYDKGKYTFINGLILLVFGIANVFIIAFIAGAAAFYGN